MGDLVWQKWFEIGHDTIDFEHKTFFSLIHKAHSFAEEGRSKVDIRRVLDELLKYTDFHFTSEENVMAECDYPGLAEHKKVHNELMMKFREDVTNYEAGAISAQEIVVFLFDWLLKHTITEDIDISAAVKKKNLSAYFKTAQRSL